MSGQKIQWKTWLPYATVLSDAEAAVLSRDFKLTAGNVAELREVLRRSLTISVFFFDPGAAKTSERRGQKAFEDAARSLEISCQKTDAALAIFRELSSHPKSAEGGSGNIYPQLIQCLEVARAMSGSALRRLLKANHDGLHLSLRGAVDGRNKRDLRREMVYQSLISYWQNLGRKPSYSTNRRSKKGADNTRLIDPVPNVQGTVPTERGGDLLEFILAVGLSITDPPTLLPRETIRNAIKEAIAKGKEE